MDEHKKIALLDTDFVSKTHIIHTDETHRLADLAIILPDYSFCCHQMTVTELSRHGVNNSQGWLQAQIDAGRIQRYTDQDILNQLGVYYDIPQAKYLEYLKNSCDAFERGYFETHYAALIALSSDTDDTTFLTTLKACDDAVGENESLGEKKSLVLLQLLQFLYPQNVYVFCSDDGGARTGVVSIGGVHCISVLSLFYWLKAHGFDKETMEPYFSSYETFIGRTGQTAFKVWLISSAPKRIRVPCRRVFDDIYDGKFSLRKTGDLEYLPSSQNNKQPETTQ